MKLVAAILFAVLAVSANADMWDNIDWDKVVPVQDLPVFKETDKINISSGSL